MAGLKAALRPVVEPVDVVPVRRSITVLNDEHREALRARGYADRTLRQRKMLGSWLAAFEQNRGELLNPCTYDLATHDQVLSYLRFQRNLAQNTVTSFVRAAGLYHARAQHTAAFA
jgi:integrase/recombinase XerD